MKFRTHLIIIIVVLACLHSNAQFINLNPDPNGDPWIAGDLPEITPEIQARLDSIPEMVLSSISSTITLPPVVDNSKNMFMRSIFLQEGGSCGQASGVAYTFTYEINRLRNFPSNDSSCLYPTHYTWNFLNQGIGVGSWYFEGWDIIIENGCPNVSTWGGIAGSPVRWMTGYENYYSGMYNKVDSYWHINVGDSSGLNTLKHWINDHNEGDEVGGLACFAMDLSGIVYKNLPSWSVDPWKSIIADWNWSVGGFHSMTFVGYNDSIKYDINNDGLYTNDKDTNGDSIIDMLDWEIGALKVANSYGVFWKKPVDSGFIYLPYRLLPKKVYNPNDSTQYMFVINSKQVHVVVAKEEYTPELTLKLRVDYPCREKLRFEVGYAQHANETNLLNSTTYSSFINQGGCEPMQGISSDPIDFGLDFSYWYLNDVGKIFFIIDEDENSNPDNGTIKHFSIIDYRWDEEFELYCDENNVAIVNDSITTLSIDYDLIPFSMYESLFIDYHFDYNKICRRKCIAYDDAEVTFGNGINVDFYNGTLIIEEDAELILEDNVTLTAKKGVDSLIVYGNLEVGRNVKFTTDWEGSLVIDIRNSDLDLRIAKANFENVELIAQIDSLCIDSCTFTDSHIEFQRFSDQKFFVLNSTFEDSFVTATVSENAERDRGRITINNCYFENTKNTSSQSVIDIGVYKEFVILSDSLLYNDGTGMNIHNSGSSAGQNNYVKDCYIKNNNTQTPDSSVGIIVYHSYADIENNHISDHNYGIACFDKSNVQLFGPDTASSPEYTQHIYDNLVNQVYAVMGSFPFKFEYNSIYNNQTSDTLVYYSTLITSSTPYLDVTNNDWGSGSLDTTLLHPLEQYLWDPEWEPGGHKSLPIDEDLFYQAVQYIKDSSYADAESNLKEIIEDYPDSKFVPASVKDLLALKRIYDQDFSGLQSYLDSIPSLWEDSVNANITEHVINWCNIDMEDYATAIAWFESQIENPVSYADSICAIIDLSYTYTLFDTSALKSIVINSKFPQFRPVSKADFNQKRKYHTGLLFKKHSLKPKPDPEDMITDIQDQLKAFPNPFTNKITFQYYLADDSFVKLIIYNGLGEKVFVIADEPQQAGQQFATFYSNDLSPGIYYCSLEVNGSVYATEKIICLKP